VNRGAPRRILAAAQLLYDGLGRPRRDAAALIQTEPPPARLIAVGDRAALRDANPDAASMPIAEVIAPAPVNAHTHLDLSTMPHDAWGGYLGFVRAVLAHGRAGGRNLAAARAGLAELRSVGTDTIGDIVTDEAVLTMLLDEPNLAGVAYWEVIGPDPTEAETIFAATIARIARFRARERPGGVRVGLSPHAPHTVSAPLLTRLANYARAEGLPLQIHVAEDAAELPLHASGDGPIRDAFGPFLRHFVPSGRTPIGFLASLGVLHARPTLVHAVHVDDDDLRLLQRAGCAVVHCPRSNATLGSGTFPWAAYARHGVSVALGTDSRASGSTLSVIDEWRAAQSIHGPAADPTQLVWAAVKGGHRALATPPPRVVRGDPAATLRRWDADGAARDVTAPSV
jgi:aminodeoxyfutalosine deaminase